MPCHARPPVLPTNVALLILKNTTCVFVHLFCFIIYLIPNWQVGATGLPLDLFRIVFYLKQHKRFWFSKLYCSGPGDHSSSTFLTATVRMPNTARHKPHSPTHKLLYNIYTHTYTDIDMFWLKRRSPYLK